MRATIYIIVGAVCAALSILPAQAEPASAELIQARIDEAEPGTVLHVPAGEYHGNIILKNAVTLVGAGPGKTILDGGESRRVVSGGKNTALIGFTIRKGVTGVSNQGNFIGIFNCRFENIRGPAVVITRGTAVIGNNEFIGFEGKTSGLSIHSANPYVFDNVISNQHTGISVAGTQAPYLTRNTFTGNKAGIRFYHEGHALLFDNRFADNTVEVDGHEVIEEILPKAYDGLAGKRIRNARPAALRRLMDVLYPELIATHSKVTYDLRNPRPGLFYVTTEHQDATFAVHAATRQTRIPEYDAYDRETDEALKAEYRPPDKLTAGIAVENETLTECAQDRYVLDTLYEDPEAWFLATDGTLRFVRHTNMSRIAVILPDGFEVASFNHEVRTARLNDHTVLEFSDVGMTRLELVLKAARP